MTCHCLLLELNFLFFTRWYFQCILLLWTCCWWIALVCMWNYTRMAFHNIPCLNMVLPPEKALNCWLWKPTVANKSVDYSVVFLTMSLVCCSMFCYNFTLVSRIILLHGYMDCLYNDSTPAHVGIHVIGTYIIIFLSTFCMYLHALCKFVVMYIAYKQLYIVCI